MSCNDWDFKGCSHIGALGWPSEEQDFDSLPH